MTLFPSLDSYGAYAGIGSRETPEDICGMMKDIAKVLYHRGYILRSGGAKGADSAFEQGTPADAIMEIFVPWSGFENKPDMMRITAAELGNAMKIAEQFHPNWGACTPGARKLHTRNVFQILGRDLHTPSKFVICWTRDGKATGGTGQALRIAEDKKIPIYNLQRLEDRVKMYNEFGWENEG